MAVRSRVWNWRSVNCRAASHCAARRRVQVRDEVSAGVEDRAARGGHGGDQREGAAHRLIVEEVEQLVLDDLAAGADADLVAASRSD